MIKQTHLSRAGSTSPPVAIEVGKLKIQHRMSAAFRERDDVIERDIGGLHLPSTQATLPAVALDDGVEVDGFNRCSSLASAVAPIRWAATSPNRVLIAAKLLARAWVTTLAATVLAAVDTGRRVLKPSAILATVEAVASLAARSFRDVTQGFAALRTGGIATITRLPNEARSTPLAGSWLTARFARVTLADAHTSEYSTGGALFCI